MPRILLGIFIILLALYVLGETDSSTPPNRREVASSQPSHSGPHATRPPAETGYSQKKQCPKCSKPNALSKDFCTGCGAALSDRDIVWVPDNPFLEIINGTRDPETVRYRNSELLVFDDRFGASLSRHVQVIPLSPRIGDIRDLEKSDIPLLERLYAAGLQVLGTWAEAQGHKLAEIEHLVFAGFNYPVSVKHLHLHLILPPFRHTRIFDEGGPRWHPLEKVLADLRFQGYVKLYTSFPQENETRSYYARAMRVHAGTLPRWLAPQGTP